MLVMAPTFLEKTGGREANYILSPYCLIFSSGIFYWGHGQLDQRGGAEGEAGSRLSREPHIMGEELDLRFQNHDLS